MAPLPQAVNQILGAFGVKIVRTYTKTVIDSTTTKICETNRSDAGTLWKKLVYHHFDGKGVTITIVSLNPGGSNKTEMQYFPLEVSEAEEEVVHTHDEGAGIA